MPALALNTPPATDPAATSTPAGVTSVPETDGKARGSGLWGYAGDVKTRASGKVFSYGLSVSPADGALWVTDSAKIVWSSNAFGCRALEGKIIGGFCYVGESRVLRYGQVADTDWARGDYAGNGTFARPSTQANAGVGVNYVPRSDAMDLNGSTLPGERFGGARGVAATDSGGAWVLDSDFAVTALENQNLAVRTLGSDGTEGASFGQATWPSGNSWTNRHHPLSFDYPVGIARLGNGNLVATSQTPELLKEYQEDGTFVRNIVLTQPAGSSGPGDRGYRSPYAVAADPSTPENDVLVGYIDPEKGNPSVIERFDLDTCTSESVGAPAGSSRDRCEMTNRIGAGVLEVGVGGGVNDSNAVTFAIQVEPSSGDIYVGQRQGKVQVFASDGEHRGSFPGYGTGSQNGKLDQVRGIGFDERGLLYATTSQGTRNTRVQIFGRTPDPVTGLTAAYPGTDLSEVSLTWDAPASAVPGSGQLPLRDYVVEVSTDAGTSWRVIARPVSTDTSADISGLDPTSAPVFRVSAWNEAGNGDAARVAPKLPASTLLLEQAGNGQLAPDSGNPAKFPAGTQIAFTYRVTNQGPSPVSALEVTDSVLGDITQVVQPEQGFTGTLAPGESVVFGASGPLAAGAYSALSSVTGSSQGVPVSATAQWHGFGTVTSVEVTKKGNGLLAETSDDAARVPAGLDAVFTYTVTNTGNVPATLTGVADDQLGEVTEVVSPEGFAGVLAPGATAVYTATGPVAEGEYHNTVSVGVDGQADPAQASWFGVGVASDLSLLTTGNGVPAPDVQAPHAQRAESSVSFVHRITNGGTTRLTINSVTDSVLGELAAPTGFNGVLEPLASVEYTASSVQAPGATLNEITVSALDEFGASLTATDSWNGFGVTGGLSVVMRGDGTIADSASSPHHVRAQQAVDFSYTVTNTSNAPIQLGNVASEQLGAAQPPTGFSGELGIGENVTFTGVGTAPAGVWATSVLAAGSDASGAPVSATHAWHGFGVVAGLEVVVRGSGMVAPSAAEAVPVRAGSDVQFRYTVTNRGNTAVSLGTLTDSALGTIPQPPGFSGSLAPGESVEYRASGPVALGAYVAEVTAVGEEVALGLEVSALGEWHGLGVADTGEPGGPGGSITDAPKQALPGTGGPNDTAVWATVGALSALIGCAILLAHRRRGPRKA